MDYLFFGIQGSGKGTQTKMLNKNFGIPVFETGHELREMAKKDTELGKTVKETIESGNLVTNEIVMAIVEEFLNNHTDSDGVIFDGIPRNLEQQKSLHELLDKHGRKYNAILITLSKPESVKRLLKRAEIENRADDTPEKIEKRINIFYEHTEPLLEHYRNTNTLIEVAGENSIEEVYEDLIKALAL